MRKFSRLWKRVTLSASLGLMAISASGCNIIGGLIDTSFVASSFFVTTPPIPVPITLSGWVEDRYHYEGRYGRVPILDPVEGENAPLFCMDPPSPDHVMRTLPDNTTGGIAFLAETRRNNVRMVVEPIVDRLDDCRFIPMVGPARLHHCHYKCTLYFEETKSSCWPVPFTHTDQKTEVVYIDKDHYIRCAGPKAD